MDHEINSVTPSRQMSGRRSKPSMDLLIDNQRVLSQYIVPQKKTRLSIPKRQLDEISVSNVSELSSISSKGKRITKPYRRKIIVKSSEENISPKIIKRKRKIMSPIINGSNDLSEIKNSTSDNHSNLPRSPYSTLKIKKIDNNDNIKLPSVDSDINKEDDDLPLCKVFPDFKPKIVTEPVEVTVTEKRTTPLVLPPKKKIKFININELNGFQVFPKPVTAATAIIVSKSDILALPKIPKKSHNNSNNSNTIKTTIIAPPLITEDIDDHSSHNVPESDLVETHETESPPPPIDSPLKVTPRRCVRDQCTNVAIDDIRWEREFCSPDCAVLHTKNVFVEWLQQKQVESDAISV